MVALTQVELNNFERANRTIKQYVQYSMVSKNPKAAQVKMGKQYVNELPKSAKVVTTVARNHKTSFSKKEVEQIIQGYTMQHLTIYQLADKHDCHRNTISKLLKKNGVEVTNRCLTNKQITQAIELYESGLSLREISKEFGFNGKSSSVSRALHKADVEMRPPKRRNCSFN
jgi:predicted DNA-binding protein YlxM (UPF0122 family)